MTDIFIKSKYTKWYFNIVNNAKLRNLEGYGENHHIHPKSCGGSNQADNLVRLTAKEHFVCHHILTKIMTRYEHEIKMNYAFWRMITGKYSQFITARGYEYHKLNLRHSKETKQKMSDSKKGKNNPFYGKQCSLSHKQKLSVARKGKIHTIEAKHKMSEKTKGKLHPKSKWYKIKNVKSDYQKVVFCLKDWCIQNNVNEKKLRRMLNKNGTKTPTKDGWFVEHYSLVKVNPVEISS